MLKWRVNLPGQSSLRRFSAQDFDPPIHIHQLETPPSSSELPVKLRRKDVSTRSGRMKQIVRVELHSDTIPRRRANSPSVRYSLPGIEIRRSGRTQSEDRNQFEFSDSPLSSSSSLDSITSKRQSIASGFTNLVIEAAFDSNWGQGFSNKEYDLVQVKRSPSKVSQRSGSSRAAQVKTTFSDVKKADTVHPEKSFPLTVCGNNTDDDIYSEACMLFDSESTIYEALNNSLKDLNKGHYKRNISNHHGSRSFMTLPTFGPLEEKPYISLGDQRLLASPEPESLIKTKDSSLNTRTAPKIPRSANALKTSSSLDALNISPPLLRRSSSRRRPATPTEESEEISERRQSSVRFKSAEVQTQKRQSKFGSTWDKINFTGSLGKRRSKLLTHTIRKFDENDLARESGSTVDVSRESDSSLNFQTRRSSSDSRLIDPDPSVANNNSSSEESIHNCGRSQSVNSSFRKRITKFFQDCPRYPSSSRIKKTSSTDAANSSSRTKNSADTWSFRKLIKMRRVSLDSIDPKQSIDKSKSSTKNIYRIIPKNRNQPETAKFYIKCQEEPKMEGKEPLHDVQFFHTPRRKLKPPDPKRSSSCSRGSIKNLENLLRCYDDVCDFPSFKTSSPKPERLSRSCSNLRFTTKRSDPEVSIKPLPRTVILTRVSPRLIIRDEVHPSLSCKYENILIRSKSESLKKGGRLPSFGDSPSESLDQILSSPIQYFGDENFVKNDDCNEADDMPSFLTNDDITIDDFPSFTVSHIICILFSFYKKCI